MSLKYQRHRPGRSYLIQRSQPKPAVLQQSTGKSPETNSWLESLP
jgi:hypothetical protein